MAKRPRPRPTHGDAAQLSQLPSGSGTSGAFMARVEASGIVAAAQCRMWAPPEPDRHARVGHEGVGSASGVVVPVGGARHAHRRRPGCLTRASEKLTEISRTSGKQWGAAGNTGQVDGSLTSDFACLPWPWWVLQRSHNPKVAGSNPAPATKSPGQEGRISVRPFAASRDLTQISHRLTESAGKPATPGFGARPSGWLPDELNLRAFAPSHRQF